MSLSEKIKTKAVQIGFDLVGITTAQPVDKAEQSYFKRWLACGHAAEMKYLYRNIDKRFEPRKLLPGARSVICTAVSYSPAAQRSDYRIAAFAVYEDYHSVIKERLLELADYIQSEIGSSVKFKACVDSVPLAERALAQRAGLGFIGRSRMLIHPKFGSRLLLGELITTAELEPDPAFKGACFEGCRKCMDDCPTGALTEDGLDAGKCISYLTIEEGDDSLPEKVQLHNYVFGCDECLNACPYNSLPSVSTNRLLKAHPEWLNLTRQQIASLTQEQFESFFAHSGLMRLGLDRLRRNCGCR